MRPVCHQAIEPANYARLIDANIDFAHAIAIHKKSFGQRIPLDKAIRYQVEGRLGAAATFNYDSLGSSRSLTNFFRWTPPVVNTVEFLLT